MITHWLTCINYEAISGVWPLQPYTWIKVLEFKPSESLSNLFDELILSPKSRFYSIIVIQQCFIIELILMFVTLFNQYGTLFNSNVLGGSRGGGNERWCWNDDEAAGRVWVELWNAKRAGISPIVLLLQYYYIDQSVEWCLLKKVG